MKWCLSMVFTISRPCAQALGVPCLTGKCWTSCLTLHPVGIAAGAERPVALQVSESDLGHLRWFQVINATATMVHLEVLESSKR